MEYGEGVMFRFLQFALGLYDGREFLDGSAFGEGFDWQAWYDFAKKQSLLGIVFDGIQKLPQEVKLGEDLTMTWFGICQKIKHRNAVMDRASVYVYQRIREAGYRSCVLKGQGNALLYPHPSSRTPGDVDVWVMASREEVEKLASGLLEEYANDACWGGKGVMGKVSLNHVELSLGKVAVELHSTPAILNNPVYHARLQKWLRRNADLQCSNVVDLPDGHGSLAIPTNAFNVIYQLFHLYHHYFYEGVGLRQIIDYYFVVCDFNKVYQNFSNPSVSLSKGSSTFSPSPYPLRFPRARGTETSGSEDVTAPPRRSEPLRSKVGGPSKVSPGCAGWDRLAIEGDCAAVLQGELKHLGLWKFAGAVMYVLHEVLGLSEDAMIAPMDSKRGKLLLREILIGGNFGQHDSRHHFGRGVMGHNIQRILRDVRLVRYYPAEALSEPVFRTWHFFWRMWRK